MVKAYRLPPHVRPSRYDIHLHARVGEPTFRGQVRIRLLIQKPTEAIELHARDIDVSSVRLEMGGRFLEAKAEPVPDTELVRLRFAERVPGGEGVLDISYTGKVQANMEGLYLSKDGPEECLATQCEETDARAIFPCFDEPAFKASFAWAVTTSPDATVLANGALLSTDDEPDGSRTWRFAPTRRMSSYLVALVVGKLASTPEVVVEGVPMRVWATGGKERLGEFGRDYAARLLPWFNSYFGTPYAFGKYDQAGVPSFSAGAMENSGLVIFRQSLLLRDEKTTSWQQEKRIALVIAHEFAHQWFGNLVTMAWWDDLWLNESFAEWIAYRAVHDATPSYEVWDDFQASKREALASDALASTHPIYAPVATPEEATELFDAITYNKGSAVMRMLENFLGEEAFRVGLRTYMQEFAERNAKGSDLWRHLETASKRPVSRIMESWVLQGGFPLVSVKLEGASLRLSQRRFLSTPTKDVGDQLWAIPLVVRYADDAGVHEARHLLDTREGELKLGVSGTLRSLTANADGVGFYRQDLDDGLRRLLLTNLDELTSAEQMDLLDDAWALVRNGSRGVESFLELLAPLMRNAANHAVLSSAVGRARMVEDLLEDAGDADALARFRRAIGETLADERRRLGFEPRRGEKRDDAERRVAVLSGLAGVARDAAALASAVALADAEARDPSAADPTLAGAAVMLAARFGDAARFEKHLAEYDRRRSAGASPAETQRYLYSLAAFEDGALTARLLDLMRAERFPLESFGPLLRQMLTQRATRVAAWGFMKSEWRTIRTRLGDMWTGFLVDHTGRLPVELKPDVVAFLDANLGDVARQAYGRALEALDQRAELESRIRPGLVAWAKRLP